MHQSPSADELLEAVSRFLTDVAAPQLSGQAGFHARVAANALALVRRELALGDASRAQSRETLTGLLAMLGPEPPSDQDLDQLNRALCAAIAAGQLDADTPGLLEGLDRLARLQLAVDQPGYSGLTAATPALAGPTLAGDVRPGVAR